MTHISSETGLPGKLRAMFECVFRREHIEQRLAAVSTDVAELFQSEERARGPCFQVDVKVAHPARLIDRHDRFNRFPLAATE
jgi:hypothetical protein